MFPHRHIYEIPPPSLLPSFSKCLSQILDTASGLVPTHPRPHPHIHTRAHTQGSARQTGDVQCWETLSKSTRTGCAPPLCLLLPLPQPEPPNPPSSPSSQPSCSLSTHLPSLSLTLPSLSITRAFLILHAPPLIRTRTFHAQSSSASRQAHTGAGDCTRSPGPVLLMIHTQYYARLHRGLCKIARPCRGLHKMGGKFDHTCTYTQGPIQDSAPQPHSIREGGPAQALRQPLEGLQARRLRLLSGVLAFRV